MPFRPYPLFAALVALPLHGEEFSLERHTPADFRYRYLSISPRLHWDVTDHERQDPTTFSESDREQAGSYLGLRYGSEISTRRLLWSLGSGLDVQRDDSRYGNHETFVAADSDRVELARESEDGSWRYQLHAHPKVHWFLPRRLFLSASAESRFMHSPALPVSGRQWQAIRPPAGSDDTARFQETRTEGRRSSLLAGLEARVGGGMGRIERVGFAAAILDLLDRITEVTGRPARISLEGLRDLEARVEARRKLRPFMDWRRASLHDLETVETYLRERGVDSTRPASAGVAGSLPPRALLAMAEEWNRGQAHRRESGFEVRLQPYLSWTWSETGSRDSRRESRRSLPADSAPDRGPLPSGSFDSGLAWTTEDRNDFFTEERILGVGLEAAWRRPWRRRFQIDADAHARASTRRLETGQSRSSLSPGYVDSGWTGGHLAIEHPRVEGYWDLSLSWYPDSRSRVTGGAGGFGARSLDYTGSKASLAAWLGREPVLDSWRLHHRVHAEAEYRPGYRVSFTVSAIADLDWSWSADEPPAWLEAGPQAGVLSRRSVNRSFRLWADLAFYLF